MASFRYSSAADIVGGSFYTTIMNKNEYLYIKPLQKSAKILEKSIELLALNKYLSKNHVKFGKTTLNIFSKTIA